MSKREGSVLTGMGSNWTEGRRSVEASEDSSVMESTSADSTMTGSSSGSVEPSVLSATVSNVSTVGAVDLSPSLVDSSGPTSSYINMNTPRAPSVKTSSSVEVLQISQVI